MNGYKLSAAWFKWAFTNPQKHNPNHTALFFFAVEHCNSMGWKKTFGLPTTIAMEAIGIKSYNTYIKTFNDIIDFGFFILVEKSKNQYTANIIELSNFDKALDKALDEATTKHLLKQLQSTGESNDSINKLLTKETIELINNNASLVNDCLHDWINNHEKVDVSARKELFNKFWNYYNVKEDKKKCEALFMKIKESDLDKIRATLPNYISRTGGDTPKFRKNPFKYLNGEMWNDEKDEKPQTANIPNYAP